MLSYSQLFDFPYVVLMGLGLWRTETKKPFLQNFYWGYQTSVFFFITVVSGLCICEVYFSRNNFFKASTSLIGIVTVVVHLSKNILIMGHYNRIQRLVKKLKRDIDAEIENENYEILLKAMKEATFVYCFYYCYIFLIAGGWVFPRFFNPQPEGQRKLFLPIWIPWDYQKSPEYELACSLEGLAVYFEAINGATVNLCVLGAIIQISCEYEILMKNINRIGKWCRDFCEDTNTSRTLTGKENENIKQKLTEIIRHHSEIVL